jgi:hypothetical protein
MDKKILYIMHVDWDWIKQRPHFIAEGLSVFFDLYLLCNKSRDKIDHVTKKDQIHFAGNLYEIPFCYTRIFYPLFKLYPKIYIKYLIKKYNPDYVWITFPILYDYLPSNKNYKIIYDCMDNLIEFHSDENFKLKILKLEKKLIEEANLVFASSKKLVSILNERYNCNDKLYLVRNAFGGNILESSRIKPKKTCENVKICYIGTVSSWFDFESLNYTLKKIENIEYHIIGPVPKNVVKLRSNKRMKFHGPIEHSNLMDYSKEFDCMIMPFEVNDLVLSVDPVKFYDYINFNKPIISIDYPEIERFSQFVYFYSTKEELTSLLIKLLNLEFPKKYSAVQREEFLKKNSWDNRMSKIICLMNKI